jgi:ABC-2 type transport system permease protein
VIRLLRSEALRTRSRRVLWALLILAALGILVGVTIGTVRSQKPSEAQVARALRVSQQNYERCVSTLPQTAVERGACGRPEDLTAVPNALKLANLDDLLDGLALILVLLGVILGSSLGGAEWPSGSNGLLLTWEPRRVRVFLVRGLMVGVAVGLTTLALATWLALLFRLGVALRGTTLGSSGWVGDVGSTALRIAAIASLFALIAYGAAMLGRSSVFGIAILFGYLVGVEGFLASLWFPIRRWALVRASVAAVTGSPVFDAQTPGRETALFTPGRGWFVVGVYVVGVLVLALLALRTRDVN